MDRSSDSFPLFNTLIMQRMLASFRKIDREMKGFPLEAYVGSDVRHLDFFNSSRFQSIGLTLCLLLGPPVNPEHLLISGASSRAATGPRLFLARLATW